MAKDYKCRHDPACRGGWWPPAHSVGCAAANKRRNDEDPPLRRFDVSEKTT